MTPMMPDRPCWVSTIGLFIINFGTLDLHVQDYLETHLPPEEFAKFKNRHFRERIARIQEHATRANHATEKKQAIEQFFVRLEPIRELRNHIAHGILRMTLAEDQKTLAMTLSLPRDLDGSASPDARHLTFEELLSALTALTALIEEFEKLFGNWVTDVDVRF